MSEDVCDSWEDIIPSDNDGKLTGLKVDNSQKNSLKKHLRNLEKSKISWKNDDLNENLTIKTDAWEGMIVPKDNDGKLDGLKADNSPKNNVTSYLNEKSETNTKTIDLNEDFSIKTDKEKSVKVKDKSYDLSNFINSQPFVPQSQKNLQIYFEDNTRSQLVPTDQKQKVKILQRPKNDGKNGDKKNKLYNQNGLYGAKTFKEREAEYAKARLRILGSAGPSYTDLEKNVNSNTNIVNKTGSTSKDDNLIRKPHGPTGAQGFTQRR